MASSLTKDLNRVQFVAEDFATYRAEADAFYQTYYPDSFNNLIATDLGNALMDQLAYAMQSLSFMVNRRSSELFLQTAKLNKSVVKVARMLGYSIAPGKPATTTGTIRFPKAPYTFPVTIQSGFQFTGPGNIVYEYANNIPLVLAPGQTHLTGVPLKEGQTKRISFVSDGSENQQFSIFGIPSGNFLYSDGFVVTVDGVEWERIDLLKYVSENIYEVLFTDEPPKLRFGDGIAGNIPKTGASIVVRLRYGKGAQGSIGSNQISDPVAPLVANGITIDMEIENAVSTAGEDPEDIRHVKAFASSFFRTQNAAVIKTDYDTIAELQNGVAMADARIMRGITNDMTIQASLAQIAAGIAMFQNTISGVSRIGVSGLSSVGVSGLGLLTIGGIGGVIVGGTSNLGVSGISFLGTDVSGNVSGIEFLGVSGISTLQPIGLDGVVITGIESVGVSGVDVIGVSGVETFVIGATSGISEVQDAVSGLAGYLSFVFSDTSKANQVQVVLLGVDSNNKYIAPSTAVLQQVQQTLQSLADAVVTVTTVDGSPNIVPVDIEIELGLSQNAVQSDVETQVMQSLTRTTQPYGLLVRREAGKSLYRSDIQQAIEAETTAGDINFMNIKITSPQSLIDDDGNLIIKPQQVIQNANITVTSKWRVVGKKRVPIV